MKRFTSSYRGVESAERLASEIIAGALIMSGVVALYCFSLGLSFQLIDPASLIFVLGGLAAAALLSFSLAELRLTRQVVYQAVFTASCGVTERLTHLVAIAAEVRKQGPLFLETEARSVQDRFFRNALTTAVDHSSSDRLRELLERELESRLSAREVAFRVVESLANYAPSFGFIGSLLGLSKMLTAFSDIQLVAASMGSAMLTTLYGVVVSQLLLNPILARLARRGAVERLLDQLTVEGLVAITEGQVGLEIEYRLRRFSQQAA